MYSCVFVRAVAYFYIYEWNWLVIWIHFNWKQIYYNKLQWNGIGWMGGWKKLNAHELINTNAFLQYKMGSFYSLLSLFLLRSRSFH